MVSTDELSTTAVPIITLMSNKFSYFFSLNYYILTILQAQENSLFLHLIKNRFHFYKFYFMYYKQINHANFINLREYLNILIKIMISILI